MRDKRFIAEHRGGPLTKQQHVLLMKWAIECSKHVLTLSSENLDPALIQALETAKAWMQGEASVGEARKASAKCHAVARETNDPVLVAVARAIGHAVATAHMADHSLGPAWYALKAVKCAGGSIEKEREWQNEQLQPEIRELALSAQKLRKI